MTMPPGHGLQSFAGLRLLGWKLKAQTTCSPPRISLPPVLLARAGRVRMVLRNIVPGEVNLSPLLSRRRLSACSVQAAY
jgi:hypothetical protein